MRLLAALVLATALSACAGGSSLGQPMPTLQGMANEYLTNVSDAQPRQVPLWRLGAYGRNADPVSAPAKMQEATDFAAWLSGR